MSFSSVSFGISFEHAVQLPFTVFLYSPFPDNYAFLSLSPSQIKNIQSADTVPVHGHSPRLFCILPIHNMVLSLGILHIGCEYRNYIHYILNKNLYHLMPRLHYRRYTPWLEVLLGGGTAFHDASYLSRFDVPTLWILWCHGGVCLWISLRYATAVCREISNIIASLLKFAGYIHNHKMLPGNIFGLILKNQMAATGVFSSFSKDFCGPSRAKGVIGRDLKFAGYVLHYKILTGNIFGLIWKN